MFGLVAPLVFFRPFPEDPPEDRCDEQARAAIDVQNRSPAATVVLRQFLVEDAFKHEPVEFASFLFGDFGGGFAVAQSFQRVPCLARQVDRPHRLLVIEILVGQQPIQHAEHGLPFVVGRRRCERGDL